LFWVGISIQDIFRELASGFYFYTIKH